MNLKTVQYEGCYMTEESGPLHKVVYALYDDSIVFSGLHGIHEAPVTSTINAAESVIDSILAQEHLVWHESQRYFDLLTHRGYPQYPSGFIRYTQLVLRKVDRPPGFFVSHWHNDVPCPDHVLKDFAEHIGQPDPSIKVWKPDEALAAGYRPTETHSHSNGYWVDHISAGAEVLEMTEKASPQMKRFIRRMFGSQPAVAILVDHANEPAYLALSQGERYCIWSYNTIKGN